MVYIYQHAKKNDSLFGVTAAGPKVQSDQPSWDWNKNKVVEFRPFIRDLPDANGHVETRFCHLSTVVTLKDNLPTEKDGKKQFISSAIPKLACVDAQTGQVVWFNPAKPETWEAQWKAELAGAWAQK